MSDSVCCQKHREGLKVRQQDKIAIRKVAGLCQQCGKAPHLKRTTYCVKCYLKLRSSAIWRTTTRWQELLELFHNQKGRCPYLDCQLTLGEDTELDHIVPQAEGGTNDIGNLQWVHQEANWMKDKLLEEQFVSNCIKIAIHRGKIKQGVAC